MNGSIPDCIGDLSRLTFLDFANNEFTGPIPEGIGKLSLLSTLYFSWEEDGHNLTNSFDGGIPSSFSQLSNLKVFYVAGQNLRGPIPDFSGLLRLDDCVFYESNLCYSVGTLPESRVCHTPTLPVCEAGFSVDCGVMSEWLPGHFDTELCCNSKEVSCEAGRIVSLDLFNFNGGSTITSLPASLDRLANLRALDVSRNSISEVLTSSVVMRLTSLEVLNLAYNQFSGTIPEQISNLTKLESLFLQGNILEGPFPVSLMVFQSNLEIVDLTGNSVYIVNGYSPPFKIIGSTSLLSLSTEVSRETGSMMLYLGVSITAAVVLLAIIFAVIIVVLTRRRKHGKTSSFELAVYPKYTSDAKDIRILKKIATGGFGVVWKGKYGKEIVAIKMVKLSMENMIDGDGMSDKRAGVLKGLVDEASLMQKIKHPRIVEIIAFEVQSMSIVMEYMEVGSLQKYIWSCGQKIEWKDRYQLMLDISEGMTFLHSPTDSIGAPKLVLFHQDLKSGNVLLTKVRGVLRGKISDFGLSCLSFFI